MNESQIALLFGLFAGSDVDTGKYQSLLELAVTEVRQALREDADESDARLNYLAAAVALVHYTELTAPRDRTACTLPAPLPRTPTLPKSWRSPRPLPQAAVPCAVTCCWTTLFNFSPYEEGTPWKRFSRSFGLH